MKMYFSMPTIMGRSVFFEVDTKAAVHQLLDWEVDTNDATIWFHKLTITYSLEGHHRHGQDQLLERDEAT